MMKITKYLTAIVVISILSNHVKCASKKSDGTTLTKSGVMKTAFSEQKTAGEKMEQECGKASIKEKSISSRIAGGYEVTPHSIPWQVQVLNVGKEGQCQRGACGGSLINSRNVITAAHCVVGNQMRVCLGNEACEATSNPFETTNPECKKCLVENLAWANPSTLAVVLGQHKTHCIAGHLDTDGTIVPICSISAHPSITSIWKFYIDQRNPDRGDNDFAILWLANKVTFNEKISPVCLPTPNMANGCLRGKILTTSGWGLGSVKNGKYVLTATKLFCVSNDICAKANLENSPRPIPNLTKNMLCAGQPNDEKTTCPGDSGGPLTYDDEGKVTLVGVTSMGIADPGFDNSTFFTCIKVNGTYNVFARVTAQLEWIKKELEDVPKICQNSDFDININININ